MPKENNLSSFLYDVGFRIIGKPNSTDREAIYVPSNGSVSYDTLNAFFIQKISEKRNVEPELIQLITSMRAKNVIFG